MVRHVKPTIAITAVSNSFAGLEVTDEEELPAVSEVVKETPTKRMPKLPPKKLCKDMAPGEHFSKKANQQQSPTLAGMVHPVPQQVHVRNKKVKFARRDDCMKSLVDDCKCKEGVCKAHIEFEILSKGMQDVRMQEKTGRRPTARQRGH